MLFQRGFLVRVPPGVTLDDVLRDAGFSRKYLDERVQTIFLDGSVVDEPQSEPVRDGSSIALSAALPGLAGAIFRKGNTLSVLRSATAKRPDTRTEQGRLGIARIKLYNVVAEEMGPELLGTGVLVKRSELEEEFAARRDLLETSITEAELDGEKVEPATLFKKNFASSEHISLFIS